MSVLFQGSGTSSTLNDNATAARRFYLFSHFPDHRSNTSPSHLWLPFLPFFYLSFAPSIIEKPSSYQPFLSPVLQLTYDMAFIYHPSIFSFFLSFLLSRSLNIREPLLKN